MSSKNVNNQGRRTPLSLNPQMKLSQQLQQQTRRSSTSSNEAQQQFEPRYKQQVMQLQQKQQQQQQQQQRQGEEKKEIAATTSASGSVTDPVPVADVSLKQQQQQRKEDGTNGFNNGTESNASSNNNGSKATVNTETNKNEMETRNKSAAKAVKVAAVDEKQNNKNGGEVSVKDVVTINLISPPKRKQQQPQQQQPLQQLKQLQEQQKQLQERQKQLQEHQSSTQQQQNQQEQQAKSQQQQPAVETKVTGTPKKPVGEKVEGQQKSPLATAAAAAAAAAATAKEKTQQPQELAAEIPVAKKTGTSTPKKEENPQQPKQAQVQQSKSPGTKNVQQQSETVINVATKSPTKVETPAAVKKFTMTTAIDDDEIEISPRKSERKKIAVSLFGTDNPKATSTPGKLAQAAANVAIPALTCSDSPRTLNISGRRSIRTFNDWTPSNFENNSQFRGSYRRIKTDLDETNDSNTSLNVTVGSEPGSTSWFSFRSRKRERTPTDMPIAKEELLSPPKRARFGFLSVMASPFSLLRSRFARASIQAGPSNDSLHSEEEEEYNVSMGEDVSIAEVDDITPLSVSKENSPKEKESENLNISKDKAADMDAEKNKNISDSEEVIVVSSSLDDDNSAPAKNRCNVM